MDDNNKIKNECLNRWDLEWINDERLKNFNDFFDERINQIPQIGKPIVLTLLKHFDYYSRALVNKYLCVLNDKLLENGEVNDENTVYAYIKSADGISNSSNDYWMEYKILNNVNRELCYENIDVIKKCEWKYIENIVYIDDFIGSGDSFLKEIKKRKDVYAGKNIYFITICSTSAGIEVIEKYCLENDIHFKPITINIKKKAFESNYFKDDNTVKEIFTRISLQVGIPKKYVLGYNETQSLVSFYNNTPNNTLGIFSITTDEYKPFFPRIFDKKPKWREMKEAKRQRNKYNYLSRKGR